ncbi:hypothetical protein GCM10011608_09780 [Micromonospora sonchi]|uniref:Uncharacterized protein n=1 Tax=Micromonospora sonchi TaxID=1763543 RepID=A0A917WTC4_9ACTN|nr:hypothetical protein [Micromonospora sonchi]GGM27008.1 hypothetical protein GCM10011608_09780 [Micromonospora sonchi]
MATADQPAERGKPKCGGKRRGEGAGKLCTRPAGWGTDHPGTGRCKMHGGSTKSHKVAGQKALAEQAVKTFGLPREIDPRDALLEEVHRTAGAVAWLHEQVQALTPDQVVWGKTEEVDKQAGEFPGVDTKHAAEVNVWVQLWRAERAHLVKVCEKAIGAGLEERRVRLAEQQGAMLAGVIKAILGDLDLSPEQQTKAATVVPFRLRAVATAG